MLAYSSCLGRCKLAGAVGRRHCQALTSCMLSCNSQALGPCLSGIHGLSDKLDNLKDVPGVSSALVMSLRHRSACAMASASVASTVSLVSALSCCSAALLHSRVPAGSKRCFM